MVDYLTWFRMFGNMRNIFFVLVGLSSDYFKSKEHFSSIMITFRTSARFASLSVLKTYLSVNAVAL